MILALGGGCTKPTVTSKAFVPSPHESEKSAKNSKERHTQEGRVYEQDKGISIIPPEGWVNDDKAPARFLPASIGPKEDGFPTLNVASGTVPVDIEQVGAQLKKSLAAEQKKWECAEEGFTEIDNKKAYFISSRFVIERGDQSFPIQNLQFLVPSQDNKKSFVVTFTASADKFEGLHKRFEESAQTIRVD